MGLVANSRYIKQKRVAGSDLNCQPSGPELDDHLLSPNDFIAVGPLDPSASLKRSAGSHSYLSATIGSTRVARCAGKKPEKRATTSNAAVEKPMVGTSLALTPNSRSEMTLEA